MQVHLPRGADGRQVDDVIEVGVPADVPAAVLRARMFRAQLDARRHSDCAAALLVAKGESPEEDAELLAQAREEARASADAQAAYSAAYVQLEALREPARVRTLGAAR